MITSKFFKYFFLIYLIISLFNSCKPLDNSKNVSNFNRIKYKDNRTKYIDNAEKYKPNTLYPFSDFYKEAIVPLPIYPEECGGEWPNGPAYKLAIAEMRARLKFRFEDIKKKVDEKNQLDSTGYFHFIQIKKEYSTISKNHYTSVFLEHDYDDLELKVEKIKRDSLKQVLIHNETYFLLLP